MKGKEWLERQKRLMVEQGANCHVCGLRVHVRDGKLYYHLNFAKPTAPGQFEVCAGVGQTPQEATNE